MKERCHCCGTTANIDGFIDRWGNWICVDCVAEGLYNNKLLTAQVSTDSPWSYPYIKLYNLEENNSEKKHK